MPDILIPTGPGGEYAAAPTDPLEIQAGPGNGGWRTWLTVRPELVDADIILNQAARTVARMGNPAVRVVQGKTVRWVLVQVNGLPMLLTPDQFAAMQQDQQLSARFDGKRLGAN